MGRIRIRGELAVPFDGEEWKPIPGWKTYRASSTGRISESGYIIYPFESQPHYIRLSEGINKKSCAVAGLILLTFVGPPPPDKQLARHLDDDPFNNTVGNLAWGDKRDNTLDAIKNGKLVYIEERSRKISQSKKGVPTGQVPWNKGQYTPDKVRKKISISKTGKYVSIETRIKQSEGLKRMWERRRKENVR